MNGNIDDQALQPFGSDFRLGNNPFESSRRVWRDLTGHTWQTWMIFRSGFTATLRQTYLGALWGFIMPLVPLFAFFALTLLRVFPSHETIPPLSYMSVGVILWLFIQGLIMAPAEAVAKHASVLKSTNFPMICIFVASYGQLAFEMLLRLLVVVPMLLFLHDLSLSGAALLPLVLLPVCAFSVALGILFGLAGILVQDFKNVLEIIFRYLIFVSFAIFPLSMNGIGGWLYSLNPIAIFIDNGRSVLILGQLATPGHYYASSVLSVVLLLFAIHLYYVLERRVAGAL